VEFQDFTSPPAKPLINTAQLQKLCRAGALGYVLQISRTEQQHEATPAKNMPTFIEAIILEFANVFAPSNTLLPQREHDHSIPLKPDIKPPNIRPYRVHHQQKEEVEKLINKMLQDELIRPSYGPYSSPAILVRKKNGSWRLCVDYRELNDQTVKNRFPIPVIEDLLDELHGAKFFSKLNLKSGYHQVRMKAEDIHQTTFKAYLGHYEFLVMPFGLTNAPATFQNLMNDIFAPYLRKFVLVFFDDILIYSKTEEHHSEHLRIVLQLLI
jgi:hypothetical protein